MKIIINNKEMKTQATNLAALADELKLPERGVAVAIANRMVPRSEWEATPLCEGEQLTMIQAACGG
ncbi:MAG: sulfur carrier protein ThiS [Bacteroidales bacterium]|nr:sulfur carrier protein ThiS [Candidatus Physcousia equi]